MGLCSFLKYTFIIFAAHPATSCGPPSENHCYRAINKSSLKILYRKFVFFIFICYSYFYFLSEFLSEFSSCILRKTDSQSPPLPTIRTLAASMGVATFMNVGAAQDDFHPSGAHNSG
jgi:hypothetical protein